MMYDLKGTMLDNIRDRQVNTSSTKVNTYPSRHISQREQKRYSYECRQDSIQSRYLTKLYLFQGLHSITPEYTTMLASTLNMNSLGTQDNYANDYRPKSSMPTSQTIPSNLTRGTCRDQNTKIKEYGVSLIGNLNLKSNKNRHENKGEGDKKLDVHDDNIMLRNENQYEIKTKTNMRISYKPHPHQRKMKRESAARRSEKKRRPE